MNINYKYITTIVLTVGITLFISSLVNRKSNNYIESLSDSLAVRNKKIILLDSMSKVYDMEKNNTTLIINRLTHNTDSLKNIIFLNDSKINNSKTKIITLNKQYNEKINFINTWNSNNYNSFFSNYFKTRK